MFLFTYTAAILTIIFIGFAAFIFKKKPKDPVAKLLCINMLADGLWIGSNAMADISTTPGTLIFWSGMALIGASFFASTFLCFVDAFIHEKIPAKRSFFIYLLPSIFFSVFAFSKYSIADTFFPPGLPAQIAPGTLYNIFPLFLLITLLYCALRVAVTYRGSGSQKRKQIVYIDTGFIIAILGGVIFDAILPLKGEFRFYTLGPQFSIFLAIFSAYAILKHQLLDIKIVIQKGLIYTILLGAIVFVYLTLIFGLNLVIGDITGIREISALLTIILGIFSVPIIDKYLKKITNPIFFKDTYDYSEAMRDLSEILNKNITVSEIAQKTSDKLKEIFKNRAVEIILLSEETSSSLRDKLASNEGSEKLSIPILLENKQLAFMTLEQKISGDQYTNEDLNLLKTFANQAAVALQKAIFFEQIKTHSEDLEKKVEERTTQIKILQQDQKQMMIDIAHGLQSPLTIIMGHLNFLKKELPYNKDIEIFEYSIDEVSKLIYDLLKLAALEGSIENYSYKPFNLSDALNGLLEYFDVVAQSNDIKLNYDIKPDITIAGDRRQIEESITNIVSNAMKYINNENDKEISISLTKIDDTVELKIKDTGIGIAAKDLPHIFERFYRVQDEIHKNIKGAGLGLAISKRIIEKFNGTIEAESEVNKGTTFTIKFKLN